MCPIHGKSFICPEGTLHIRDVFNAMSFEIQESDVKPLYEKRIADLDCLLRKKFPSPPLPNIDSVFNGKRYLATPYQVQHWPPILYLRSDTRSKIFEVFA